MLNGLEHEQLWNILYIFSLAIETNHKVFLIVVIVILYLSMKQVRLSNPTAIIIITLSVQI
jgi:hypothetical protein